METRAQTIKPHRLNSQALCEAIYRRLQDWVPDLRDLRKACVTRDWDPYYRIQFSLEEHTPYSSLLTVRLITSSHEQLLAADFSVRVYHDAQVAEVVAYQGHKNLQPFYEIPNALMYQRNEKRLINRLFFEFLNLCLRRKIQLDLTAITAESK